MKKAILPILALSLCAMANADTYNYLTIKTADKTISLPLDQVENVTFTVDDLSATTDYEIRTLTFEDADYRGEGNYLGKKDWSSLIDSPQYGGPLLYGDYEGTAYRWYDQGNTELAAAIDPDDDGNVYWNGGEAVSNYVQTAEGAVQYTEQLATYKGGYNGSKNFCVHNGYFDGVFYNAPSGGIWFEDGVPRVIDHMYVSVTAYQISSWKGLDGYSTAATADDWVKFVAIGTDAQGNTHQVEITMNNGAELSDEWVRWDLSELGEIVRLDFNITSSLTGAYGMSLPGYIAYDNIAVRFKK